MRVSSIIIWNNSAMLIIKVFKILCDIKHANYLLDHLVQLTKIEHSLQMIDLICLK